MTTRLTRWLTALGNFETKIALLPAVRRYGRLTRAAWRGTGGRRSPASAGRHLHY